jgi:hypothetical protein
MLRHQYLRWRGLRLFAVVSHHSYHTGCGRSGKRDGVPRVRSVNADHEGRARVTFAFGSVGHNVFFDTAAGAPADIPGINANTSVTRIFNTAGTFTYICHIHPSMQGTVVVQ